MGVFAPRLTPVPPASSLIESFDITLSDGHVLRGHCYRTHRTCGRRIVVMNASGVLFDTGDCYDLGNAQASLDEWLAERM